MQKMPLLRFWVCDFMIRYHGAGVTVGVGTYIDGSKIIVQAAGITGTRWRVVDPRRGILATAFTTRK